MSDIVVIGPQRKRELFFAAQGGLILILGIARLMTGYSFSPSFAGVFPLLMIAAGLVVVVAFLFRYRRSALGMEITDAGLSIHRPPVGTISWRHVGGVRADRVRGRQFLHIALGDTVGFLAANPSASRWMNGNEVWFDASRLDMDVEDIAREITERRLRS